MTQETSHSLSHTANKNSPSPATVFSLLRHGMTRWNEERRIQGRCDSPLSANGKMHIQQWATNLIGKDYHRILASDLGRVQQTVTILNHQLNLPVHWDQRLREIDWGLWEGRKLEDVKADHPEELSRQTAAGWNFRAPDGESRKEALIRAKSALTSAHEKWEGQRILVVCHLGIIKCLLYDIMAKMFLPNEKNNLSKDSLHTITCTENTFTIDSYNITLTESP